MVCLRIYLISPFKLCQKDIYAIKDTGMTLVRPQMQFITRSIMHLNITQAFMYSLYSECTCMSCHSSSGPIYRRRFHDTVSICFY